MRKVLIVLPFLLLCLCSLAQQKIINGVVVRNTTKEPLQGVTVSVGAKSVMTGAAGHFSIAASPGQTIVVSLVGMNSNKLPVSASTTELNLAMDEDINDVNQVVVTG